MLGEPIALITLHHAPQGVALTATGGVELHAATIPGVLRHLASTLDGKPVNPRIVGPLMVSDLPDGVVPLAAAMSIKALSAEGLPAYYERVSHDLTNVEALGMVTTLADSLRARLIGLAH